MKHKIYILGVILSLCSVSMAQAATDIHCGYVLDVEAKKLRPNQHILVEDGRITAIGSTVNAPAAADKINLSDRYCAPGLMDAHVHLFLDLTGKTGDQATPTQSSAYNALMGLRNAQILLNSGFTTIRIPGDMDYHYAGIELRNAINRGEFTGPRMLVAPHPISPLGGHGDLNSYAPDLPVELKGVLIADGVDEIRKAVRREIKYGADWIKIMATGGVMSQNDDPTVAAYTQEELNAFADETHRHKKKITAHAIGESGIRMAVEAGFDSIEHATMLSENTAKLMAKKGTIYVPTQYVVDWIMAIGEQGGISANNFAKAKQVSVQHDQAIKLAYKHGVKMVLGSDPIFPMDEAIREFSAMARRIPDNWYVLQTGTINSAQMLGLSDQIGSLKVGKQADIVAMPNNPITDMKNIENVGFVMKGGIVVRNDY